MDQTKRFIIINTLRKNYFNYEERHGMNACVNNLKKYFLQLKALTIYWGPRIKYNIGTIRSTSCPDQVIINYSNDGLFSEMSFNNIHPVLTLVYYTQSCNLIQSLHNIIQCSVMKLYYYYYSITYVPKYVRHPKTDRRIDRF